MSERKKQPQEDLDSFLTSVESKLRGPFSSLDLAKAMATTALRGSLSPKEYLIKISQVLSRTDKAIQMRILLGMLGLDPSEETDGEIWNVLTQAQEAPVHEEWVRSIAGLVQGIMFQEETDTSRESCRGDEAKQLLIKTCGDIVERVKKIVKNSCEENAKDEKVEEKSLSSSASLSSPDMNAFFAPYYYSLLPSDILEEVVPECKFNTHFGVDETASILHVDEKLEMEKAKEELEHKQNSPQGPTGAKKSKGTSPGGSKALPPGFRPAKLTSKAKPKTSSSMFMPTKRTVASRVGGSKVGLHTRRAGAAQSLLAKNKMKQRGVGKTGVGTAASKLGGRTVGGASTARVGGRAAKLLNNRSKMKMIETSEVDTLNKEHQARDEKLAQADKYKSRKRKIMEAAAQRGLVAKKAKKVEAANGATTSPSTTGGATNDGDATSNNNDIAGNSMDLNNASHAAVASVQVNNNQQAIIDANSSHAAALQGQADVEYQQPPTATIPTADAHLMLQQQQQQQLQQQLQLQQQQQQAPSRQEQEWQMLLKERSNKLSADDRFRVKQFFEDHYNPTPDQPVYKMKLHEERTNDATTGQAIKETFYLELDYRTFTSRQSKKVKRY